jgi:hypothetical protein
MKLLERAPADIFAVKPFWPINLVDHLISLSAGLS